VSLRFHDSISGVEKLSSQQGYLQNIKQGPKHSSYLSFRCKAFSSLFEVDSSSESLESQASLMNSATLVYKSGRALTIRLILSSNS
jgi:hypothetical protein